MKRQARQQEKERELHTYIHTCGRFEIVLVCLVGLCHPPPPLQICRNSTTSSLVILLNGCCCWGVRCRRMCHMHGPNLVDASEKLIIISIIIIAALLSHHNLLTHIPIHTHIHIQPSRCQCGGNATSIEVGKGRKNKLQSKGRF